ncbi:MAG: hypothetical protein KAV45_01320 [Calditrichia bacterium]|nr:hypothetical protein [Calditrichia bacterium]
MNWELETRCWILDDKIKALLTGKQLELYEELKIQHKKRRFHHFPRTSVRG